MKAIYSMCQALGESHDVKKAREAKIALKQRKSERAKNGDSPHVVFRTFYSNRYFPPTILEPAGKGYM